MNKLSYKDYIKILENEIDALIDVINEKNRRVVKITDSMCVGADELYCDWYRCPICNNDVITGNDGYCSACGTKIEFSK